MTIVAGLFIAGILLVSILVPLVIKLGVRLDIMDYPGELKIHVTPVPRIGGVAIFVTSGIASSAALAIDSQLRASFLQNRAFWLSLVGGATIVFTIGLLDDKWKMPLWSKFAAEIVAAFLVMFIGGLRIQTIGNPFDGVLELGWLWIPITVFWIVGVTNSFNLIDGLDGLATGVASISVLAVLFVTIFTGGRSMVVMMTALLAGSLLGFLRFNFHPAKIFLGDCGSLFIGFILAVLSLSGGGKRTMAMSLLVPAMVVGVPIFDTLLAMHRRLYKQVIQKGNRRPTALLSLFIGDKSHIHHILLGEGCGQVRAVLIIYGLSLLLAVFAIAAALVEDSRVAYGLIIIGAILFFIVRRFGGKRFQRKMAVAGDQSSKSGRDEGTDTEI